MPEFLPGVPYIGEMMGGALIFHNYMYMYMYTLLASFFLPSHLSFKNMYMYVSKVAIIVLHIHVLDHYIMHKIFNC